MMENGTKIKPDGTLLNTYELLSILGKGSYGRVYKARRKIDGHLCVVKQVSLSGISPSEREEALNEHKLMAQINHFHIIQLEEAFIEEETLYIVMEFASGGDLALKAKNQNGFFNEETLWTLFIQLSQGIECLHENRILHRDIKPQNVFLDGQGNIKIGDLGLGRALSSQSHFAYTGVGTPLYVSPEMIQEHPYNTKSDVWALGCLMYELAAKKPPFMATNHIALSKKIVDDKPSSLPKVYSPELQFLIFKMLEKDPARRPDIQQILNYSAVKFRIERSKLLAKEREIKDFMSRFGDRVREEFNSIEKKLSSQNGQLSRLEESQEDLIASLQSRNLELEGRVKDLSKSLERQKIDFQRQLIKKNNIISSMEKKIENYEISFEINSENFGICSPQSFQRKNEEEENMENGQLIGTPTTPKRSGLRDKTNIIETLNRRKKTMSVTPIKDSVVLPLNAGKAQQGHYLGLTLESLGLFSKENQHENSIFQGLFAWRKGNPTGSSIISSPDYQNERLRVSKVWSNKERYMLVGPSKHFILLYRVNPSLRHNPNLKCFRIRCQHESEFIKLVVKQPESVDPKSGSENNYFLEIQTIQLLSGRENQDAIEFILEFDTPNSVDEVSIVKYDKKLLEILSKNKRNSFASPQILKRNFSEEKYSEDLFQVLNNVRNSTPKGSNATYDEDGEEEGELVGLGQANLQLAQLAIRSPVGQTLYKQQNGKSPRLPMVQIAEESFEEGEITMEDDLSLTPIPLTQMYRNFEEVPLSSQYSPRSVHSEKQFQAQEKYLTEGFLRKFESIEDLMRRARMLEQN